MLHCFFLSLFLPQGAVHVVDSTGGAGSDFASIGAAVSAAADGDVVLVRAGLYGADTDDLVFLQAKGLAVVAERGASVRTTSAFVQDLPATTSCLLQGLEFEVDDGFSGRFRQNLGPVWVERCSFTPSFSIHGTSGPVVEACESFVMARSVAFSPALAGSLFALRGVDSRLHLFESAIAGLPMDDLGLGLRALELENSRVELSGTAVLGAEGRDGNLFLPDGQDGGVGMLIDPGSRAWRLDSDITGGPGGNPFGTGVPGDDGQDIVGGGVVVSRPGQSRSLEYTSPVREGEAATMSLHGNPGDTVWLLHSVRPARGVRVPGLAGEILLSAPRVGLTASIPAGGVLVLPFTAADLPPGREGRVFYSQAVFRDAQSGSFVLSAPSAFVLLDESL